MPVAIRHHLDERQRQAGGAGQQPVQAVADHRRAAGLADAHADQALRIHLGQPPLQAQAIDVDDDAARSGLRIAPRAFVSFPNFAHWRVRLALLWNGRMPVTRLLPVAWYETPNIHHVTVADFRDLVRARGIGVEAAWYLSGDKPTSAAAASWRAEHAIFLIARG